MKVLRLLGVLALGACGKTMPTSPVRCTADRAFHIDTSYFDHTHIINAIAYECK